MGLRLGPNETEAHLRPDFGRTAVSEVGSKPSNLRKPRGFQSQDRGSGEFEKVHWRRGRDSNPRYGFPHTHFPGVRLQPLGHPSAACTEAHAVFYRGDARIRRAVRLQPLGHPSAACAWTHADALTKFARASAMQANRTCAGHKPSRPSRQAAKRRLGRSMSITFQNQRGIMASGNRISCGSFAMNTFFASPRPFLEPSP